MNVFDLIYNHYRFAEMLHSPNIILKGKLIKGAGYFVVFVMGTGVLVLAGSTVMVNVPLKL